MSTTLTALFSDHDMQCPAEWYGGFKEGRVRQFGSGERSLSDLISGDWQGSSFSLTVNDTDRLIREWLSSLENRYWPQPLTIRMTTRANRADLGVPYTVFVGPIIDAQPRRELAWDITLGDVVSQRIVTDQHMLPWRMIGDGLLDELSTVSEQLQLTAPEPIIYGIHTRTADDDPTAPYGYPFTPIYLGVRDVNGTDYHVWMVAGHACADLPDISVDGVSAIAAEGVDWLVPHHAGHDGIFGTPYEDITSRTYTTTSRRYTLVYGRVGYGDADDCAEGTKQLTVSVEGVEPVGDGTGAVLTDRIDQFKHFLINFVANSGPNSYQYGEWLPNPTWSLSDGEVEIVEEVSFEDAKAIAEERLPAYGGSPGSPVVSDGYHGAAILGGTAEARLSAREWIARWNVSCGVRFGITHLGQMRVSMLHPTQAIKDAAPLYTDAYEMLHGSFETEVRWTDQANQFAYTADYEWATGAWKHLGIAYSQEAIDNYQREIRGAERVYHFAPGTRMLEHIATIDLAILQHPRRLIRFEATVGPNPVDGSSLGYLDLGDYIRYRHYAAVSDDHDEIRLAQVVRHQVQAGSRRVLIEALDCDDLIGFDTFDQGSG